MISQPMPLPLTTSAHLGNSLPSPAIRSERKPKALGPVIPLADSWSFTDVAYGNWRRKVDSLLQAHLLVQGSRLEADTEPTDAPVSPYLVSDTDSISPFDFEDFATMASRGHESAVSALRVQLNRWRMIAATVQADRESAYTGMSAIIDDPNLRGEMQAAENDDSSEALLDWLLSEINRLHRFAFAMTAEAQKCLTSADEETYEQKFRQVVSHWHSRQQQILNYQRLVGDKLPEGSKNRRKCYQVVDATYSEVVPEPSQA